MAHPLSRGILAFVGTFILMVPALATMQTTAPTIKRETAPFVSPADGPAMFKAYCSACHGVAGKGDGPAAPALTPKPADLTTLAKRRGGTFSAGDFEEKVIGRTMTRAHGNGDMPVWGPVFSSLGNEQLRLHNLREYVESLQVK